MVRKIIFMLTAAACSASVWASELDGAKAAELAKTLRQTLTKTAQETASAAAAAPAPSSEPAEWTIMAFVNGRNNLEKYALKDANEMEYVGSTDKIKIVAEVGRMRGYDSSDGNWEGSRRYLIKKDGDPTRIASPVLQTIAPSDCDMGDWRQLVDFIKWAKTNFPAKHYMLIVWNHGSGWNKNRAHQAKGISYDDVSSNHITTEQLGQALAAAGHMDIYASDACLMQMLEVDYEIKNYVDLIVGSEETEPGDGYTYDSFLEKVVSKSKPTALDVAKAAADSYTDHYLEINQGATQSVVDTKQIPAFAQMLDEWTKIAMAGSEKSMLLDAKDASLPFYYADNKDLHHFLGIVAEKTSNTALAAKSKDLMEFISAKLVLHNRTSRSQYENAKGIAIYLPEFGLEEPAYADLQLAKETNWYNYLGWLFQYGK